MNHPLPPLRPALLPLAAASLVLLLAALPLAHSLNVTDSLNVQATASPNTMVNSTNAAIGVSNSLGAGVSSSLVVGSGNYLVSPAVGTVVAGSGNAVETATKSAVFGRDHYVSGSQSLVGGSLNGVEGGYSFSYGFTNWVGANATSAMAGGQYTIAKGAASASLGHYTTAHSFASVAVGQYNKKAASDEDTSAAARTSWRSQDTLFAVGNGTATVPSNAFLVKKDGTIVIKKQGDIPMTGFEVP